MTTFIFLIFIFFQEFVINMYVSVNFLSGFSVCLLVVNIINIEISNNI